MKAKCIEAVNKIDPTAKAWKAVKGFAEWMASLGRKKRGVHTSFIENIGDQNILNVWQDIYKQGFKLRLNITPWQQTEAVELGLKKSLELWNITR